MRIAKFVVPEPVLVDFAQAVIESNLPHLFRKFSEDREVVIEIQYKAPDNEKVDHLEEYLDQLIEESEEE